MKAARGFTLIEVLVAMAITAIVAVLAYGGLDSAVKLSQSAEVEADRLQRLNRVFDILARDFRQVIARPVRSAQGDAIEPALFLSNLEQPMLRFTRSGWINPDPQRFQRSELQRVNYMFEDGKIKRISWQMLDRYDDSKAQEIILFKGVRSFEVKVLADVVKTDFNGLPVNDGKGDWINTWPIEDILNPLNKDVSLPIAIEIVIESEKLGRIRRVFELSSGVKL